MGYKARDIENSLKGTENTILTKNYKKLVDKQLMSPNEATSPNNYIAH